MLEYICIDKDFNCSFEKGTDNPVSLFPEDPALCGRAGIQRGSMRAQQTLTASEEPRHITTTPWSSVSLFHFIHEKMEAYKCEEIVPGQPAGTWKLELKSS